MEEIKYKILNPGGNKTGLVEGINFSNQEKKKINDDILNQNADVEQVGFLDKQNRRLEMAGGEFCVNATRCAIWECLEGKAGTIKISVSGCNNEILGGVTDDKKVYANMQIDRNVQELVEESVKFTIIKLDGIVLLVMSEENSKEYIEKLQKDVEKTKLELKQIMANTMIDEKALGVIMLEKVENKTKINPVIWVKSVDTLYYETACGSGSLAAAIYMNYKNGIKEIDLIQPSGYAINVKLDIEDNYIKKAIIQGVVEE